ncbi:MAG TPA: FliM/FliN family flagellar motor switch protein [Hyphomicrobiaceae bacterium]|nr:FliM/FliN family flagellar motor switch protein [Hyphomicrobiaceae bacterium]
MTPTGTPAKLDGEALKAIFSAAFDRVDRLPALQTALERAASICSDQMRDVADPPPELVLSGIESGTAAHMLAAHEDASVVGVLNVAQWSTRLLLSADRRSVFSIVEMSLGGDGAQSPYDADRNFSKIEQRIAAAFFAKMAEAFDQAFAPIAKAAFVVDGASDRIDFDVIGRRNTAVIVARFLLRVWGREGELLLVIPKAAIDPMRQVLGRPVVEEPRRTDPGWSSQIRDEITRTSVALSAVLDERLATLEEIANLTVGQILQLNATPQTRVRVECNGEPLLWCQLGKSNGVYTLRVEEPIDRDQEFMNDILAG